MVLLSGGIDSTACVAFYLAQRRATSALFVDYGQLSVRRERRAATAVAAHYQIPLRLLRLGGLANMGTGLIQGRNGALLALALMASTARTRILGLGIHAGTPYVDCSTAFSAAAQSMLDLYTAGAVQLGTPFLEWRKGDIVAYCRAASVPLNLTYSCERGTSPACGRCSSCRDRVAHACA
jgi:7-cyano-7-deazaguanine synthase